MRPSRLILFLFFGLVTLLLLVSISRRRNAQLLSDDPSSKSLFAAWLSFDTPLFPSSAIISLTDDNSTFFLSRPAAFGPMLPNHGLSGPLWIGSRFGEDSRAWSRSLTSIPDQLGCSEASNSDPNARHLHAAPRRYDAPHQIPALSGRVVLLSRGGCSFLDKVEWAQRRGAVALIVGDNVPGGPLVTMYAKGDTSNITIPALFTSHTTAHLLSSLVPPSEEYLHHAGVLPPQSSSPSPALPKIHRGSKRSNIYTSVAAALGLSKRGPSAIRNARESPPSSAEGKPAALGPDAYQVHDGLWVTLTPTNMSSSPFFDTILVLVISPLVTLTIVYAMLLVRSRIRRRRWRAPKSVVDRLPVRTYHTIPSSGASSTALATPLAQTPSTPLLIHSEFHDTATIDHAPINLQPPPVRTRSQIDSPSLLDNGPQNASAPEVDDVFLTEEERREKGLAAWRRKYGGRQRECVVCLEEYVEGVSRVMQLPCGHEFHAECITPWLTTRRRTCPICKGDIVKLSNLEQGDEGPADGGLHHQRSFASSLRGTPGESDEESEAAPSTTPLIRNVEADALEMRRQATDGRGSWTLGQFGRHVSHVWRGWSRRREPDEEAADRDHGRMI